MILSGRIHVDHGDGTEVDLGPGDIYNIQPGHDAWVLGDDPLVGVEFEPKAGREPAAIRPLARQ